MVRQQQNQTQRPADPRRREAVRRLIEASLDESERLLVLLRYAEGLSHAEIGAVLDLSEARARRGLETIRSRMRAQLGWAREVGVGCAD